MYFVGIDHSLTAPGICVLDDQGKAIDVRTIRTGRLRGQERVEAIRREVSIPITPLAQCLVSFEAYPFKKNSQGYVSRVELVGVLKHLLFGLGVPWIQDVQPTTLKKYLSGGGAADKKAMIAAARAGGVRVLDDNQADAYGLALMLFDTYQLVAKGVKPGTIYRYEQCELLACWVREQITQGGAFSYGR